MERIENLEVINEGDYLKVGLDIVRVAEINPGGIVVKFMDRRSIPYKDPYLEDDELMIEKFAVRRQKAKLRRNPLSTNKHYIIFRLNSEEKNEFICNQIFEELKTDGDIHY